MVQKLVDYREMLIGDLISQIVNMQNRSSDTVNQIQEIDKNISDLSAQNVVIARLYTNGVLNNADFSARSSEINHKISDLRSKRKRILSEDENSELLDTLKNLNELLENYKPNNEFDEELFERIIIGITVDCNECLTFKLIGGIELSESIPMKGRCNQH